MNLRTKIQEKIAASNGDNETAVIEICKLLENKLGLSGNGWFDDDQVMLDALDL